MTTVITALTYAQYVFMRMSTCCWTLITGNLTEVDLKDQEFVMKGKTVVKKFTA